MPMKKPCFSFLKIFVFLLVLIFFGLLLVHKIQLPTDDLGRHLKNGEMILQGKFSVLTKNFYSYTEPDFLFVNHHWLSGVIFYLINSVFGFAGLVIFKVIVLLAAFVLLFLTALKKADFWLVALFSVPTILILGERTDLRPEIFSYLFIAIFLYLLIDLEKHPERKRIFWLIPCQLLWVNLHIYFFIGLALVAGFLLERVIVNYKNLKGDQLIRKSILVLLLLAIVCLINPQGVKGALYPLNIFGNYAFNISENYSLANFLKISAPWEDSAVTIFRPAVFLLIFSFIFGFFLNRKSRPIFYFLASAGTVALAFSMVRGLAFFGFIFLLASTANFNSVFALLKNKWQAPGSLAGKLAQGSFIFVLIALLCYLIGLGSQGKILKYKKPGLGLTAWSENAGIFFKEQNLHGPIFNDYDIGSYLTYNLFPQEKVFIDNRPEAYPGSFFLSTYLPAIEREDQWQEILAEYRFNAIFFYHYDKGPYVRNFIYKRLRDPVWLLVYADPYAVILLKNSPENQATIKEFQITKENIGEKLGFLVNSTDAEDQIAAGDLFFLVGRDDLGIALFKKIVSRWPEKRKVWLIMGEWELRQNDSAGPSMAADYLEKAVTLGEKTAEAYTYLGLAYFKLGQFGKAEEVLQKAIKINPDYQDAKNSLEQLQKYLNSGEN